MDVAFERFQTYLFAFRTAVESSNDTLTPEERERFVIEASMIKTELVDVANQKDNLIIVFWQGVRVESPFSKAKWQSYLLRVFISKRNSGYPGLAVRQNFSGLEVFRKLISQTVSFQFLRLLMILLKVSKLI